MLNHKKIIIVFCLQLLLPHAFAQAPVFKNIVFDKEKKAVKLLKIFQDNKGFIWIGTNLGICRYDGISFRYMEKDSNEVSAIAEDRNGTIWSGNTNGSMVYTNHMTATKFLPEEGMPKVKITAIVFDQQNRLWFSTYGEGVYCYEHNRLYNFNVDDGLTDNMVYDLLLSDDHTVWAATDEGISVCSFSKGKKGITRINNKNGLPDNIVRCLKKDAAGNIWAGLQDKGICVINKITGIIEVPEEAKNWTYGQVNDLLPMKRETFIGTEEYGIIELHPGLPFLNKMVAARNKNIKNVQQLLADRNEQVWLVADNQLSLSNSNRFQVIEIPAQWQETIKAITTDHTGKIWFANKKGIFSKLDNNNAIVQEKQIKDIDYAAIVCLYADEANNIWIGTYNNGLYVYNPVTKTVKRYTQKNGLADNNIFSITGTGTEIWLGSLGGATKIDLSLATPLIQNYTRENGLSNNYVYNVSVDSKNNKWFATDGSGISMLDEKGFHHYYPIPGLEKNIAYTTTEDIYGNIWFTGLNSGLFRFDGKQFKQYTIKDGLHDNEILNAVADNKGNLLLTHQDGLELFNIRKELFIFYGNETGLDNINPQINAYCKTPGNSILIGSADKIIQYYPQDTRYLQLPQLVMNDVLLYFKSTALNSKTSFDYDENHLSFDYAGLWYMNPEILSYKYQLDGYNKEWINTKDHLITFPNLPPGNYTFRVKTSASDDFRYAPEISYRFTILQPFWKTDWFIISGILLVGCILYYFIQLRIKFITLKEEKERQKLSAQLAVLKSQLNPHFLFNSFNTLLNIIDKDKLLALEFTEKLADFYREIALVQDKEMITVQEELVLMQNYIYLQQKRFGNNLVIHLNIADYHLKALIPPLTLQLLVENALKHNTISEELPLTITIQSAQSYLLVSNTIHSHKAVNSSAGIGLQNIRQRVKMLTGQDIQVLEQENEFNVIIPLKQYPHENPFDRR